MKRILKAVIPLFVGVCVLMPNGIIAKANKTSEEVKAKSNKRIVSYFPNWGFWQDSQKRIQVKDIPWDKVTHINHAFFEITKDFKIESTDEWVDYYQPFSHSPADDWEKYPVNGYSKDNPAGHMGEYKYYKSKYPDVKLLISVGGWTRSELFHECAKDPAKRKTLANSMVQFMKKYPYVDGFDIDWEYPGVERKPEGDGYDRGNPAGPEDKENFTLLLKDIRETFNANGMKNKLLTVAVGAGEKKIEQTEPDKYHQYVDYIGVMTYDFAGSWDNTTGHLAGLYANQADPLPERSKFNTNDAMKTFRDKYNVPSDKLLAGAPLYSRGWGGVEPGPNGDGLFQKGNGAFNGDLGAGGQYSWYDIPALEKSPEWKKFRDPIARTPYLYNPTKKQFLTYEDEQSLLERVSYVNENKFGGLIVWDASGDNNAAGSPMHTIMKDGFDNGIIIKPEYPAEDFDKNMTVDILDMALISVKYNLKSSDNGFDVMYDLNNDKIIDIYDIVRVAKAMTVQITPDPDPDPNPDPDPSAPAWDAATAYSGGAIVTHNGVKYKAKWWTRGEEPGKASVWEKI
ncbi:MAG: glycosyl hydrolase family 18 protein [Clostridium sp.]